MMRLLAAASILVSGLALAQTFPSRPLTLIVPFPPGGSTDTAARLIAEAMRPALGQPVVIENVGGAVWDAVLPLLNTHARVPLCGLIAQYNATSLPAGPDRSPQLMATFLTKQIKVQGFIISTYYNRQAAFINDMSIWIRERRIKYREDITQGLENAPEAFMGLFKGSNFGKLLVQVSE